MQVEPRLERRAERMVRETRQRNSEGQLSRAVRLRLSDGETNASLPKGTSPDELTFEYALHLLAERAAIAPPKKKKKRAAKPAAAENGKAAPKKAKKAVKKKAAVAADDEG